MAQERIVELDISERLRVLMRRYKLSVADIAGVAGVSKSAMEKYLAGPSSPRATAIASICYELGVGAQWLLFGESDEERYRMRFAFSHEVAALFVELKSDSEIARKFRQLEPDTDEWRWFVRNVSDDKAVEAMAGLDNRRKADDERAEQGIRITHAVAEGAPFKSNS